MSEPQITSIEQLKEYSAGQIVELPAFGEGQPFIARLKRPSMLALVKSGKIPNALIKSANSLFAKGSIDEKNPEAMNDLFKILDVLSEACFVEPTYKEIKDAKIELTDEQLMFVYSYSQKGVKALDMFRTEPTNIESSGNVPEV